MIMMEKWIAEIVIVVMISFAVEQVQEVEVLIVRNLLLRVRVDGMLVLADLIVPGLI